MKMWVCVVVALLCGAPCGGVAAEESGLDGMTMTGARGAVPLRETPASVETLSAREIEALRYRKPDELFNRLTGVITAPFAGEDALTSVRLPPAPAGQETVILVDGLPSFTRGRGSGDFWKYFNSSDVERIELLEGPSSPLYGSGAVGGVINVLTRTPPSTPEVSVWGEYGRNDRWRGGVSGGARVDRIAGSLNVDAEFLDGWREHSRVEKQAATGNVQYFLDDASVLRLRVDFVHAHNDLPGMLDGAIFFTNPRQSNNTFALDRLDRIAPTLTYDRAIGDSGRLNLAFQVQSNTSDNSINPVTFLYTGVASREYQGIIAYRSSLDFDIQARYLHELKPLRTRITGGIDYTHSDQQSDSTNIRLVRNALSQFLSGQLGVKNDSYDVTADAVAPYLQVESTPVPGLHLLAGARFDAVWYDATAKTLQSRGGNANFNDFTFRAGAAYDVSNQVNIFANVSRGFLAPSPEQLYTAPSYTTIAGVASAANRSLEAETAYGYEAGVRSSFWERRARLDLAYYDLTVCDKIVRNGATADAANPFYYYQNAARTSSRGVEVRTTVMPVDLVRLSLAYTYARSVYDTYAGYTGNLMPRAPENHINARLALLPVKGLEVELEVDEVTKQYADDANTMAYSRPTLVNLRASYSWQNWSIWAHLLNLTNQSYATYVTQSTTATTPTASYYPGEPLTFYVGAAFRWQ